MVAPNRQETLQHMVDLLPRRPKVTNRDNREPVVLELASEHADRVFKSLASETARRVLQTLYEEPRVASDIADEINTSLQNVDYHLQNLQEAELVEIVDTWYSEKGNEMKVYAPTAKALMVLSDSTEVNRLRSVASTLMASVLLIGIVTVSFRFVLVDYLLGSDDYVGDSPEGHIVSTDPAEGTTHPFAELPLLLDPGAVFLAGALLGVIAIAVVWRTRHVIG